MSPNRMVLDPTLPSATAGGPWVSVVIPAYNHAAYLATAVESVLSQEYPNLELIVIDDGSTDETPGVLDALSGNFVRLHQENRGQAGTLARGWAMAKGEILAYLSADDILKPGAVRTAVEALKARRDAVACYCDYALIDPDGRVIRSVKAPDYDFMAMWTDMVCAPGPGAFFRRDAYAAAGPWNPDYRQMPDFDFWLRMGVVGPLVRIPESLAAFRVHPGSQTYARATPERARESVAIVEAVMTLPSLAEEYRAVTPRALASAYLISAYLHARAGRYGVGLRALGQAFSRSPRQVLRLRTLHLTFNALFNRLGHGILWTLRRLRGSPDASGAR